MKLNQNKQYIATCILASFVIIVFSPAYTVATVNFYPTDGWQISTPEAQGLHAKSLLEMMTHIKKNGYNIQSITIVRNGYLVLDAFMYPLKTAANTKCIR